MTINKKLIVDIIEAGEIRGIPFGLATTRMSILNKFGSIKGYKRKNGVYEFLDKDGIIYYLGNGTRGRLEGIIINDLSQLELKFSELFDFMNDNAINYKFSNENKIALENGVEIIGDVDIHHQNPIVKSILIAKSQEAYQRLLNFDAID